MHRVVPLFLLLTPALGVAGTQQGIATTASGKVRHWARLPIKLCAHSSLPAATRSVVKGAAATWNASIGQPVFEADCQTKKAPKATDVQGVYWIKKNFQKYGPKLSVARTLTTFDRKTGRYQDADIVINAEFHNWKTTYIDLETVLIHEMGHVLGLQHNMIELDSAMNVFPYQSGVSHHRLGKYEKLAVRHRYFKGAGLPKYLREYFNERTEGAIQALQKRKASPSRDYALGMLWKQRKNCQRALGYFKNGKSLFALYRKGECLWTLGKLEQAKKVFQQVLRLNPHYYEALANLGAIAVTQKKPKIARQHFEHTLKVNPVHYGACFFLARLTKEKHYLQCVKRYSPDPTLAKGLVQ